MRKRKGQFISLLTVIVLVFIASGNMYGSILAKNTVSDSLEKHRAGLSAVSEAAIRAELYPERMEREFNYSVNISTVELGKTEGNPSWDKEDFTGSYEDSMRRNLKSDLERSIKREVNSQTFLSNCGNGPPAESVRVENSGWKIERFRMELDTDTPITCEGGTTDASVYIDREKSSFGFKNRNNNYLELAEQAVKVGAQVEAEGTDTIPNSISVTGEATQCSSDTLTTREKSNLKDDARANAVSNAEARLDASSALSELGSSYNGKLDKISFSPSQSSISIDSSQSTEDGSCQLNNEGSNGNSGDSDGSSGDNSNGDSGGGDDGGSNGGNSGGDEVKAASQSGDGESGGDGDGSNSQQGHYYKYKTNSYEPNSVALVYSIWEKKSGGGKKKLFTNSGLEDMLFKFEYSQNFN